VVDIQKSRINHMYFIVKKDKSTMILYKNKDKKSDTPSKTNNIELLTYKNIQMVSTGFQNLIIMASDENLFKIYYLDESIGDNTELRLVKQGPMPNLNKYNDL
jgi:hypothetical protein